MAMAPLPKQLPLRWITFAVVVEAAAPFWRIACRGVATVLLIVREDLSQVGRSQSVATTMNCEETPCGTLWIILQGKTKHGG